jgi:hypothetical protein
MDETHGPTDSEWDPLYPERDYEVIRYETYRLTDKDIRFRGKHPRHLGKGSYITFMGASQTYGCFVRKPFHQIISEKLELDTLNLGYGGVGPNFYNRHQQLIDIANRGSAVVLQVMSGRSEGNRRLSSQGHEFVFDSKIKEWMSARTAWSIILELDNPQFQYIPRGHRLIQRITSNWSRDYVKSLVEETQRRWVENYNKLIEAINVPVVLFWFSTRSCELKQEYSFVDDVMGEFPQMVNRRMVDEIRANAEHFISCVSSEGLPQPLFNRFTGKRAAVEFDFARSKYENTKVLNKNLYYPSPEMHIKAAEKLINHLSKY